MIASTLLSYSRFAVSRTDLSMFKVRCSTALHAPESTEHSSTLPFQINMVSSSGDVFTDVFCFELQVGHNAYTTAVKSGDRVRECRLAVNVLVIYFVRQAASEKSESWWICRATPGRRRRTRKSNTRRFELTVYDRGRMSWVAKFTKLFALSQHLTARYR